MAYPDRPTFVGPDPWGLWMRVVFAYPNDPVTATAGQTFLFRSFIFELNGLTFTRMLSAEIRRYGGFGYFTRHGMSETFSDRSPIRSDAWGSDIQRRFEEAELNDSSEFGTAVVPISESVPTYIQRSAGFVAARLGRSIVERFYFEPFVTAAHGPFCRTGYYADPFVAGMILETQLLPGFFLGASTRYGMDATSCAQFIRSDFVPPAIDQSLLGVPIQWRYRRAGRDRIGTAEDANNGTIGTFTRTSDSDELVSEPVQMPIPSDESAASKLKMVAAAGAAGVVSYFFFRNR